MIDDEALDLAHAVIEAAKRNEAMLTVAESCTGGLVGALLTSVAGSSMVFDRGFITYSNIAKHEMLGVPLDMLNQYGAVSAQVAKAMSVGAIKNSRANVAVSITGIAGPGGGSIEKPVGLVHFGLSKNGHLSRQFENRFDDNGRDEIRKMAAKAALNLFLRVL